MVNFVKLGDRFLCTNGQVVFGEIFRLEDGLYYYSDSNNTGGGYSEYTLKCIYEKLEELNSVNLIKKNTPKWNDEEIKNDYPGMLRVMKAFYLDSIIENDRDNNCKDELKKWSFRNKKRDIKEVLNQRQKTHGEFSEVSKTYSDFLRIIESKGFFSRCEDHHRLAIDVIIQKLSRILNGDMNFDDHWLDIIGYSELVLKQLDKNKKQD